MPRHTTLPASVLLASALCSHVSAQTSASTTVEEDVIQLSVFEVNTAQDNGYLAGNSVSATRVDTAIKDLPFSVNAFTEEFIVDIGASSLADIVQFAPGVTPAGREFVSGNERYNIRGFDTSNPQRNGFQGARNVDSVNIQRVEVVKGPASLLYGAIEPGGTINYITKKPGVRRFTEIKTQLGTDDFLRATLDTNIPIVGKSLLARFNGAWETGPEHADPAGRRTFVVAPTVSWKPFDRLAITADYQWMRRDEHPQVMFYPNIIVGYHRLNTASAANDPYGFGRLTDPVSNTYDPGFLYFFPVPEKFNFAGKNDFRDSDIESANVEATLKLTDKLTFRTNAGWNRANIKLATTGIGDINAYAPGTAGADGRIDPASVQGSTVAEKEANLRALALAFADRVFDNPNLIHESPFIYQVRRKRFNTDRDVFRTYQAELVGSFRLGSVAVKPLVGAFRQVADGRTVNRQSTTNPGATPNEQTSATQHFQPWNYKDLGAVTRNEPYPVLGLLPMQADTSRDSTDTAYYGLVNVSTLADRLTALAGFRYTETDTGTLNNRTGVPGTRFKASKTTPQIGAGFKLTRDLLVYASYSESFVPSNTVLMLNGVVTGPGVPITSDGYEAGIKGTALDGRISATLAFFRITQSDRISRFSIPDPVTGATNTTVIQGTVDRSEGFEIDATISPVENWQIYTSYSLVDATTIDVPAPLALFKGKDIENSARHRFNVWTRYSFKEFMKGLWVGGGVNYTSKKQLRINNPDLYFEPTTVWELAAGYSFKVAEHPTSVVVNWKNLTDELYIPSNLSRGQPSRIQVTVSTRF
ncbi:MAG: TonB-dependent receptor [Opitutaceae bacterium]|nr:TonB-dependent receptor [Opitutaceae bacterium]